MLVGWTTVFSGGGSDWITAVCVLPLFWAKVGLQLYVCMWYYPFGKPLDYFAAARVIAFLDFFSPTDFVQAASSVRRCDF